MKPFEGNYSVTAAFGVPGNWAAGHHTGIDFGTPVGTRLIAPMDGTVQWVGFDASYGYRITVRSNLAGQTVEWSLNHMRAAAKLPRGTKVKAGQLMGYSGNTGNVRPKPTKNRPNDGAHLHFEVRRSPFGYYNNISPAGVLNFKASSVKPNTNKNDPKAYYLNAVGPHITWIGERLVAHGYGKHYKSGPGPTMGTADVLNIRDFQLAQGWTGTNADGFPGPTTLKLLAADPVIVVPPVAIPELPNDNDFEILPRMKWTDTPDNRHDDLEVSKVNAMTLHYPADGLVTYADLTQEQVASKLRVYLEHHTKGNGWKDIGYNYAVDQAGRVWDLTGDDIGAHANTVGNTTSIGVLLVVGNMEEPSAAMVKSVNALFELKRKKFNKMVKFQPHKAVPGNQTDCPGNIIPAMIAQDKFEVKNVVPDKPNQTAKQLTDYKPSEFGKGLSGPHITLLGSRLVAHGFSQHYNVGPGPSWGEADRLNVRDFQLAQGWTGADADGYPGPATLARLQAEPVKVPATWFKLMGWNVSNNNARGIKTWVARRRLLVRTINNFAPDVLCTQENVVAVGRASGRGYLDNNVKGMKRVSGGDGRYIYARTDSTKFIAGGVFDLKPRYNNDDKQAAWAVLQIGANRILVTSFHLENEGNSDSTRSGQLDSCFAQAKAMAKKYNVHETRIFHQGDTNFKTQSAINRVEGKGWADAFDTALKAVNKSIRSLNSWFKSKSGFRIDRLFVHPKRPVIRAEQKLTLFATADHNPQMYWIGSN